HSRKARLSDHGDLGHGERRPLREAGQAHGGDAAAGRITGGARGGARPVARGARRPVHPRSFPLDTGGGRMITATVRYRLPAHIDRAACMEHFHKIAPGFQSVKGLISKHFIWSETGWAGGVYQWQTREDAEQFYGGPWRDGIVERYGMAPH